MCWGRKTGELLDGIQGQEFWGEIHVLERAGRRLPVFE